MAKISITKQSKINFEGLGLVDFIAKRNVKRISIKVKPDSSISVIYPHNSYREHAEKFVKLKLNWIIKAKEKTSAKQSKNTIFKPECEFKTRFHILNFIETEITRIKISAQNNVIEILYPKGTNFEDSDIQLFIKNFVIEVMRWEAKKILTSRVNEISEKFNFTPNRITIKKSISNWGSCSSTNNINLSLFLVLLPDHLIDYVIIHELCHLTQHNHSSKFWNLVDLYTNNKAKYFAKEMKNYSARYF